MASPARLTATSIVDLKAQLHQLDESYERLERGEKISVHDLLSVPSLLQIREKLVRISPRSRPQIDAAEVARRDHFIQQHLLEELLHELETSDGEIERMVIYTLMVDAMKKYDVTPSQFLREEHLTDEDYEAQAQLFKQGAITFVRQGLTVIFEAASLSREDTETVQNDRAPANERLNAMLRPLEDKQAKHLLDVLEQAMLTTEADIDLSDYVDAIMPENIFFNAPEMSTAIKLSDRELHARKAIEKVLARVTRATNPVDRADYFDDVRGALRVHGLTVEKYVAMYEHEPVRAKIREVIKDGALAYVNIKFRDTVTVLPSPEDEALVRDPHARPIDQLNALFRNSSKGALDLLDALEEAGFDFEEEGLTQRILLAGIQSPETPAP